MNLRWIRIMFVVAGLYDAVLGAGFLFFGPRLFELFEVTPPNHFGYVQFSALLLLVFAAMFIRIATDPVRQRELILYGCGLKISYIGTVYWHQLSAGVPAMWLPWAWADLGFLVLFGVAWWQLKKQEPA